MGPAGRRSYAKVPGRFRNDPDPQACEVVKFGEPEAPAKALASLAVARYACPSCSASFAKWSACYRHITQATCHKDSEMFANLQELQARCKEKAEKLSAEQLGAWDQSSHATARFQ